MNNKLISVIAGDKQIAQQMVEVNQFDNLRERISNYILRLLEVKNSFYGEKNLVKRGTKGILFRCEDKLSRIENIINSGGDLKDQIKEFADIAGYAIMAIQILTTQEGG